MGVVQCRKYKFKIIIYQILAVLDSIDFMSIQSTFDHSLKNQAKFLWKYAANMVIAFDIITRSSEIFLRLRHAKQCKIYSYISSSNVCLERDDEDTWNFIDSGNLPVNKSNIPFSAIGWDHAIEHEN